MQKGDKVYATHNSVWGRVPMKVDYLSDYYVHCIHPSLGRGAFPKKEVMLASRVSKLKQKQLKKLDFYEAKAESLEDKLFKKRKK